MNKYITLLLCYFLLIGLQAQDNLYFDLQQCIEYAEKKQSHFARCRDGHFHFGNSVTASKNANDPVCFSYHRPKFRILPRQQ